MAGLHFATLETPIGRLWLTGSPRGLREIQRGEHPDGLRGAHDPEALDEAIRQLERYFAGELRRFDLALDVADATRFDVAVWSAARRVPYGATRSYGELAEEAGFPRAARAAGGAMARCPLSPVVPCHRIIRADGTLGGWGADPWVKRWLLDLEQGDRQARAASP
jgi:methylated-DNA-[protein]-cysteine S-methyltransferase